MAALLHDIGHGPFSHVFENAFDHSPRHESWTISIIKHEDSQVHKALASHCLPHSGRQDKRGNREMRHLLPLMRLFDTGQEITDRTKLHKIVYILQTMDFPFREPYKYHLHGPYSQTLTHEVIQLVHLGMLHETQDEIDGTGIYRFTYETTPDLASILAEFKQSVPDAVYTDRFDDLVAELNRQSSSMLELVATALFLEKHQVGTDAESELKRRKPHLGHLIERALAYVDELKAKGM